MFSNFFQNLQFLHRMISIYSFVSGSTILHSPENACGHVKNFGQDSQRTISPVIPIWSSSHNTSRIFGQAGAFSEASCRSFRKMLCRYSRLAFPESEYPRFQLYLWSFGPCSIPVHGLLWIHVRRKSDRDCCPRISSMQWLNYLYPSLLNSFPHSKQTIIQVISNCKMCISWSWIKFILNMFAFKWSTKACIIVFNIMQIIIKV